MHDLLHIGKRLRQAREFFGYSQADFSAAIGAKLRGYQENEHGRSMPGGKILTALATLGVNINWLLTGEAEMLLGEPSAPAIEQNQQPSDDEFTLIPVYNVEASAGHGCLVGEEEQISQLAFRKDWLRERSLKNESLATIKARGDSMEPTISDKDILLIDTRIDKITDDSIYIIRNDGHLAVKRIQQKFDGSIKIISDNKRYEEETIPKEIAEKIQIAGRVVWIGHEI